MLSDTGFEPNRGACRNVEPMTVGSGSIEVERRVGLGHVHVAADLHRPVTGVDDVHGAPRRAGIDGDIPVPVDDFARNHDIGSWTVTSLVPSGNVASTCTSCSISGTPSMTSSRPSTSRP